MTKENYQFYTNLKFYDLVPPANSLTVTNGSAAFSADLAARILNAFRLSERDFRQNYVGENPEHWDERVISGNRNSLKDELKPNISVSAFCDILKDPGRHNLWYGFDNYIDPLQNIDWQDASIKNIAYDRLLRLVEATGSRIYNTETRRPPDRPSIESLLEALEQNLGFKPKFPAPWPGIIGLVSESGLISNRSLYGLYAAWRLLQYGATKALEIGGGMGYAAFHSHTGGIRDYTIIDIPLSAIASSHFLGFTCGEDRIGLYGEDNSKEKPLKILPPNAFPMHEKYDIVLNMDSMTEMEEPVILDYLKKIKEVSGRFLSINHEYNKNTVRDMVHKNFTVKNYSRHPFWLRKGYVEEYFEI